MKEYWVNVYKNIRSGEIWYGGKWNVRPYDNHSSKDGKHNKLLYSIHVILK